MGRQRLLGVCLSEGIIVCLAVLCYDNLLWALPLQVLLLPFWKIIKENGSHRRQVKHMNGFREVLQSLMTSMQAGYSKETACRITQRELTRLFHHEKHPTELAKEKIVRGIEMHYPTERLFQQYAKDTGLEEIQEFASVLTIARITGGNVVEILKNSMDHLQSRMDAVEELQVSLSGRIFEKNIMMAMPFGVLLYLRLANPEYVNCLYDSLLGNLLMTGVIGIVLACFFWTEKIMNIKF